MPTITSYENQIKKFRARRGIDISRGQVKTVAYAFYKRMARMTDLDLERIFMHTDVTAHEAIHHAEGSGYCSYCGTTF
jgi:uncharacterized protein YpiB (UPF0302 family)